MSVSNRLALVVLISALPSAGSAVAEQHNGDRGSLAGKIFYVEALIVSSPAYPEYKGATLPSCFTFEANGSFLDLEWPGEGLDPIPGVWVQHTEFPFIYFTAYATWPAVGWTLVEDGVVSPGQAQSKPSLSSNAMVFSASNELLFYIHAKGYAVEACPL